MGFLQDIFREIKNFLTWWITIAPWESGLRVRRGKHVKLLKPGMHWVIPIMDRVYIQTDRLRFCDLPIQTLTTLDGQTLTVKTMLGYKIINIETLYTRLHHAENALVELVTGHVAEYVNTHNRADFSPNDLAEAVKDKLNFNKYGIGGVQFRITDFAYVRAIRLLNGDNWYSSGDKLDTDQMTASGY